MTHFTVHSTNGARSELTIHGVPYADFDRSGHFSVWAICKTIEASRFIAIAYGFLEPNVLLVNNHAFAIRKQLLRINPRLHQNISLFTKLDMKLISETTSMGKTSMTCLTRMFDVISGEVLVENHLRFVRMNTETRRSVELPMDFVERYRHFKDKPTEPYLDQRIDKQTPSGVYTYKLHVRFSDCDSLGHVNQASYVRFCMDCATDAALNKYYRHFDSDMCMYTTTFWEIDHHGESRPRDVLDILTWQADDDDGRISFSIRRQNIEILHVSAVFGLQKQISPAKKNARL